MHTCNGSLRTRWSWRWALFVLIWLDYLSGPSLAACPVSCLYCPCFTSSPYTFDVDENSPIGTTISTLSATSPSGLSLTYSSESLDFNIDSITGALTVGSELDYETTSTYRFRVAATDGSNTGRGEVTISILNRNDFAPQCSSSIVYFSVTEGQGNILFQLPNCTDNDVPSNPTFTYSIEGTNGLFNINQEGQITLMQPLNYELQQLYDLTVIVNDTAIPPGPLSTSIRAIFSVNPVNEFTPTFSMPRLEFSIREDAGIGSTVGQITATDQDSGEDGLITYSINTGQTDTFTVQPTTGHLITTRSLDFELVSSYSFTVSAADNSLIESSRRTSSTIVVVNVQDMNDNSPTFSQSVYYQEVREDSNPGSFVLQLVCRDLDSGSNQEVIYSIISGNNEGKFQIDSTSGDVTLFSALDYDNPTTTDFFTLIGQCQEVTHPFHTSVVVILLEVTSFNEFDPLPTSVEYEVFVSESTVPGTPILTVEATDRDRGQAGVLRYFFNYGSLQLNSCPLDLISIDESTGIVYLLSHLDFENGLRDIYCIATIWDSELPPRPNEADVRITVTNVNDVGPKCYPAINTVYVAENRRVGDSVFSLPCNDSDSTNLQYSMSLQTPLPFTIDSNGNLVLRSPLDYETKTSYIIPIEVTDGTFVANSSVYILVSGINEHTPVFTRPMYDCLVPENSLFGTRLLCNIQATDRDDGNDGVVNYQFSVSHPTELFAIDDNTGDVFLTGSIDCELQSDYHLVVEAFDLGSPSFISTANITVIVSDVNDNKPETMPLTFASIPENVPTGTGVITVVCTDADQGINAEVDLQILSVLQYNENGNLDITTAMLFNINPLNGVVTVSGDIDFEVAQHYKLSILCSDHGTPSLSTQSTLFVEVMSVNEHSPVLSSPPMIVHVSESTVIGSVIEIYHATDQDRGEDGILTYSLDSLASLPFAINEQSGILTLSDTLNCEQSREYTFTVMVQDRGQPSQSTQTLVTVNITNCHLGELVPSQNVYTGRVVENAVTGTIVQTVECSSTRVNVNTEVEPVYRIIADVSGHFEISSSTGEIALLQSPDFETQHSYVISIQCYDPNYPNSASNFSVYVVVVPENEHTPEFLTEDIIVNIFESTPLGSLILQLEAFDNDDGQDGDIRYTLTGQSSSNLLLDPTTGELYLTATLDREVSDVLTFIAIAQDMPTDESTRRSSSATVTVNILDTNDNWPQCTRAVHHLIVSPQTIPFTVLLATPECTDMDIGENAELLYELGDESMEHMFEVDSLSGALTLTEELDSSDTVHFYLPLIVHDRGTPSLSTTVLVIIDVQEHDLPDNVNTDNNEYLSLVEAEGIKNSVVIVLEDFSRKLWDGSTNAEDNFQKAVAHSVTNYCALFPEACSLESGCSAFFGSRSKRATEDNYATFTQPAIVILSNYTLDIVATPDVVSEDTVSLRVQFYVTLPTDATRSPYRQTNYVVPRVTLSLIVEQDGGTIEAVVRDSVAPSLTRVEAIDGWMIATLVILAIVIPTVLVVIICITVYKIKQRSKNKVVSLISKNGKLSNPSSKTASKATTANTSKRGESKCSNSSSLSAASNKATICVGTHVQVKDRSMFISEASGRRESDDSTPRFDTPSDVSEISISDSEGASMDNHTSRPVFSRSPREMLNTLRDSKGLKTPERTSSNVGTGNNNGFPYSPHRPALRLNVPMWRFS